MGEDCVKWYLTELTGFEAKEICFYYDEKRLQLDDGIAHMHNQATRCHISHKAFNCAHSEKVRDHEHVTGKYRRPAHKWCKLRLRRT